ncbi:MAG: glycogen synthase GlgA [Clostridia bacterium]|nr:glycogen synthase GlgA [Clostridia bacterium]
MKILFVTSEANPFIKTGGLADVSFALPKALHEKGEDVRIIMPKYEDISGDFTSKMTQLATFGVSVGWRNQYCGLQYLTYDGIPVYFVDNEYYFKRHGCYGYFDDGERFSYFCRAVMESVKYMDDFYPEVIHCNDWQTGMVPLYLSEVYKDRPEFSKAKSIFTIHNLKYQGVFSRSVIQELLGIGEEYFSEDKIKFYDGISFMKAGIVYADKITTVSKTYAKEIQTAYYGEGLDGLLRQKSGKLVGITNGIDYSSNDPKKDKFIVNYGLSTLKNKAVNKEMLQRLAGLPTNPDVPVIAMVTRLVKQKGLDLVTRVIEDILKMNVQLIVLGTGDNDYQDFFEYYASSYPAKIASFIQFDNAIASKVYAGSDILLMPSLFEPCGLSQMIAMAYGTLPLVRETGGLSDTVIPYNEFTGDGNGFSFTNYNAHDMLNVIEYAVSCYQDKKTWTKLVKNAMRTKFEWKTQADEYLKIYNEILEE